MHTQRPRQLIHWRAILAGMGDLLGVWLDPPQTYNPPPRRSTEERQRAALARTSRSLWTAIEAQHERDQATQTG